MRLIWLVEKLALISSVQLNLFSYLPSLSSLYSSPNGMVPLPSIMLDLLQPQGLWICFLGALISISSFSDDIIPVSLLLSCGVRSHETIKASRDEHVPQEKPVENTSLEFELWAERWKWLEQDCQDDSIHPGAIGATGYWSSQDCASGVPLILYVFSYSSSKLPFLT